MSHVESSTKTRVAVLTVSDTRTFTEDSSGDCIDTLVKEAGHEVVCRVIVKDEYTDIQATVHPWIESGEIEVIIVTGGTGPSIRDVTPSAIVPMFTSGIPGFGELFRQLSYQEIGAAAMLSRADAGLIDGGGLRKPVFLLPGSPNAVRLALEVLILPQLGHLMDICKVEQSS
jgi:molybdenum cofactor biosynthesis protein B